MKNRPANTKKRKKRIRRQSKTKSYLIFNLEEKNQKPEDREEFEGQKGKNKGQDHLISNSDFQGHKRDYGQGSNST